MPLDPTKRKQKLEELQAIFEEYIADRQKQLHLEYEFLALVLESQGLVASSARRRGNLDKLRGLATAKELLPTAFIGKDSTEKQKQAAAALDGLLALEDLNDPFKTILADDDT